MATKQETVTVRVTGKMKRELEAMAKHERRSISNLCEYLLMVGKMTLAEREVLEAQKKAAKS